MISIKDCDVALEGDYNSILEELSAIINLMYHKLGYSSEEITMAIAIGLTAPELLEEGDIDD